MIIQEQILKFLTIWSIEFIVNLPAIGFELVLKVMEVVDVASTLLTETDTEYSESSSKVSAGNTYKLLFLFPFNVPYIYMK